MIRKKLMGLAMLVSIFVCNNSIVVGQPNQNLSRSAFHYYLIGKNKKSLKLYEAVFKQRQPTADELYIAGELAVLTKDKDKAIKYFSQMLDANYYPYEMLINDIDESFFNNDTTWISLKAAIKKKSEEYRDRILAPNDFSSSKIADFCLKLYHSNISGSDFYERLRDAEPFEKLMGGEFTLFTDSLNNSSHLVYIPTSYRPAQRHPLLIYLHGAVTREFLPDATDFNRQHWVKLAEKHQMLLLMPLANNQKIWFREEGYLHVMNSIQEVKSLFNIDDNRVFLTGFSDGGTGVSCLMTLANNPFAGGIIYNGAPLFRTRIDKKFTMAYQNAGERFLDIVATTEDELFNFKDVSAITSNVIRNNDKINFRVYEEIGHQFDYTDPEFSILSKYIEGSKRDPFKSEKEWIIGSSYFGRTDWIAISRISEPMDQIYPSSMFFPRLATETGKVVVDKLLSDIPALPSEIQSLAELTGLMPDDTIIGINDSKVENYGSLVALERKTNSFSKILVIRNGKKTELAIPATAASLDKRIFQSNGWVKAIRKDHNEFVVATSPQVQEITIYINPEMIDMDAPVKIIVNDELRFNKRVDYSKEVIKESFLNFRDRKSIWINRIVIDLN